MDESIETKIAVMANDVKRIKDDVHEVKRKLEADYITRTEFDPVKKIVYGLVALVLTGVIGALITLIIK